MTLARFEPPRDCPRCPRLVALREELRHSHPDWWNAPVPSWGDARAWLAIVGLAPGRNGANRTGRPFTGDDAGAFLFAALAAASLSSGSYEARTNDRLELDGAIILNAVRCLPPKNKPDVSEVAHCREFLATQLGELLDLRVILALGRTAHETLLRTHGLRLAEHRFRHGAEHALSGGRWLIDSYHCSRQNTNTGRLTRAMFAEIFARAKALGS